VLDDTTLARVMAKIDRTGDCWIWTDAVNKSPGYGTLLVHGKRRYAHRLSYAHFNGPIPPGMFVCHHCDVRRCVNPAHLFLGTVQDNADDASRKGRLMRGERHNMTRLTEDDVRAIRADGRLLRIIADDYGTAESRISQIKHRITWAWLD
jgi:hypothetical protein